MKNIILIVLICLFALWGGNTEAADSWNSPDGQFGRTTVTVSSVLAPQSGNFYGARSAFDGNPSTAWVEGVDGYGVNEWIKLAFGSPMKFKSLYITNGYAKNNDVYLKNSRPKKIRLDVDSGQSFEHTLSDTSASQIIILPLAVSSTSVKLTILSVYPGSKYMDTCISEFTADFEEFNYQ
ncbi:MAG: discoidin domain-containing protein [Deltaproteobacteria bacterium]|nr:discoidin domain-containing protein [Deltaproteobacteria bacterium]